MLKTVQEQAGKNEDFNHRFFMRVKDILDAGDEETLLKERIPLKLMRLTDATQEGFVMTDFPQSQAQAEMLEEYKGGLNAFVHINLPAEVLVDIEEAKYVCDNCDKVYYSEDVINAEYGIRIEKHMPKDHTCGDCGSQQFHAGSDPIAFERQLEIYNEKKDEVLNFYNHYGLLVDYELRAGFDDYEKLKRQIQYIIKH